MIPASRPRRKRLLLALLAALTAVCFTAVLALSAEAPVPIEDTPPSLPQIQPQPPAPDPQEAARKLASEKLDSVRERTAHYESLYSGSSFYSLLDSQKTLGEVKAQLRTDAQELSALSAQADAFMLVQAETAVYTEAFAALQNDAYALYLHCTSLLQELDCAFPAQYDSLCPSYDGQYKLTGYCPCTYCCGHELNSSCYGITASGEPAREGVSVAADKRLPFGTVLYIQGVGVRIVQDRGGAIKGSRLDVFVPEHEDCYAKNINCQADVYILG